MKIENEKNKLITEFLGWDAERIDKYELRPGKSLHCGMEKGGVRTMGFHQSWDWLMPVVEKIESIHDDFHGYFGVYISSNQCTIQGTKLRTGTANFHPAYHDQMYAETKLAATYLAVVRFIEWYNQHLKQ